jgi:hypothetical protein
MRTRTAREKNQISTARDGRNAFGEKDKPSSEKVPHAKVGVQRASRKLTKQEVSTTAPALHGPDAKAPGAPVHAIGRKGLKKHSEVRLGEHLERRKIRPPRP